MTNLIIGSSPRPSFSTPCTWETLQEERSDPASCLSLQSARYLGGYLGVALTLGPFLPISL